QADLGSGFKVPKTGANTLFFGSLMAGTSPTYLVDHFYGQPANGPTNRDWVAVESLQMVLPPNPADEQWRGKMSDAGHSSPQGLRCEHRWYMNVDGQYDDWAIVTFDFTNNGSNPINGLYAGMIADFDIGSTPTNNTVVTDTVRRTTYMRQSTTDNPCAGFVLLEPNQFANIGALDHARYVYPTDSCMTDGQKFRILNGTILQRNSNRAYDWSCFVSAGPRNLPVGATWRMAVAIVGATSAGSWVAAAESAQAWYNANLMGIAEQPPVVANATRPLFLSPNPFRRGTFVHYYTSRAGQVELVAYDATGREAERQTFEVSAGTGRLYWRPQQLGYGVYFVRVESPDAQAVTKVLVME
ncbi:MAG: T9SS type A sorting domain-containing protein, partial [candidate division WOR-3 bacterium]